MGRLTKDQLNHFSEFGFLNVENLIDPEKIIDPIIEEYHTVLGNLADELYAEGKISSKYEDLEFGERVTKPWSAVEAETDSGDIIRFGKEDDKRRNDNNRRSWTGIPDLR